MKFRLVTFLSIILFLCSFLLRDSEWVMKEKKVGSSGYEINFEYIEKTEPLIEEYNDTLKIEKFWNDFKKNVRDNNKEKIIKCLNFPIRAIHPVLFRFAQDCDTITYIKNEKKYRDFDITESNIMEYYDFIFVDGYL